MGILLRSAALALGAVAATVLFALPASAHADLVRSDPPNGSVLAHAPACSCHLTTMCSTWVSPSKTVTSLPRRTQLPVFSKMR